MTAAALAVSKQANRYLMPRACLLFLGKRDRVVGVSYRERWRDASWTVLGKG